MKIIKLTLWLLISTFFAVRTLGYKGLFAIVIGQVFFVLGFQINYRSKGIKSFIRKIFMLGGVAAVIVGIPYTVSELGFSKDDTIAFIGIMFFFLIGAFMTFALPKQQESKQKRCTYALKARIVDIKSHIGSEDVTYFPVYEYEFSGRVYKISSSWGQQRKPEIGAVVDLMVNPKHPTEFYDPDWDAGAGCVFLILGIFFMAVSGIGLFFGISSRM